MKEQERQCVHACRFFIGGRNDGKRNASYEVGAGKGKGRHYGYTNVASGELGTVNRYGNAAYAGGQIFVAVYGALRKTQRGGAVMSDREDLLCEAIEQDCKTLEVINELIENLYFSIAEDGETLTVSSVAKFAKAYSIAKQLYEYDLADKQEVEDFANKITAIKTAEAEK